MCGVTALWWILIRFSERSTERGPFFAPYIVPQWMRVEKRNSNFTLNQCGMWTKLLDETLNVQLFYSQNNLNIAGGFVALFVSNWCASHVGFGSGSRSHLQILCFSKHTVITIVFELIFIHWSIPHMFSW